MESTRVPDGCMGKRGLLAWNIPIGRLHKRRNLQIHDLKPLHLRIASQGGVFYPNTDGSCHLLNEEWAFTPGKTTPPRPML